MKPLKTAKQKNFQVDRSYYLDSELSAMQAQNIIDSIFNKYVVYASNCKEIKIVYNSEFGFYETVAITHNNELVHIKI